MKYLIKYNNGDDEMLIINDDAFYGFLKVEIMRNKDIRDFHVTVIPENEIVYRTYYNGKTHFYNYRNLQKFLQHEGGQYRDLRITII